jgi:hypothetical protein
VAIVPLLKFLLIRLEIRRQSTIRLIWAKNWDFIFRLAAAKFAKDGFCAILIAKKNDN